MEKKKNLLKVGLPIILLGGAAVALYYYFKKPTGDTATTPVLPPAGSPPSTGSPVLPPAGSTPAPAPIKPVMIGKKAITNKFTPIGYSPYLTSVARYGGSDKKGNLETGRTAGTVIAVNDDAKTAQVTNYTYPAKDSAGKMYYTYYIRLIDLNGDY